jgi:hypothetical protein
MTKEQYSARRRAGKTLSIDRIAVLPNENLEHVEKVARVTLEISVMKKLTSPFAVLRAVRIAAACPGFLDNDETTSRSCS